LKRLAAKYGDDLVIIGVHSTGGGENMAAYVKKKEIPYPVGIDIEKKTFAAYKGAGHPDYYVIDQKGVLRFSNLTIAKVEKAVRGFRGDRD
jgi:hypothetical protein